MASNKSQINSMESILKSLRDDYLADLPHRINDMERQILALEEQHEFESAYQELYRNVHSIKGSAGTHGLHIITRICHCLEDSLTAYHNRTILNNNDTLVLLKFLDLISNAHINIQNEQTSFTDIEDELNRIRNQVSTESYKVLIIEQSKLTVQLITTILSEYPIKVTVCTNGMQSLEKLIYDKYDFMFVAVELPILNGLALTAAIRLSKSFNSNIPVVLLTSKDDVDSFSLIEPDWVIQRDTNIGANILNAVLELLDLDN